MNSINDIIQQLSTLDESEDEIFVGPITEKERKKIEKINGKLNRNKRQTIAFEFESLLDTPKSEKRDPKIFESPFKSITPLKSNAFVNKENFSTPNSEFNTSSILDHTFSPEEKNISLLEDTLNSTNTPPTSLLKQKQQIDSIFDQEFTTEIDPSSHFEGNSEQERLQQEKLEQDERVEAERLEKERLEKERLEQERLQQERIEQERLEHEKVEQERLEAERVEQERERVEQERLEKERLEKRNTRKRKIRKRKN